jgi:hypothetical protein
MTMNHTIAANPPAGVPFSLTLPHQDLDGSVAISTHVSGPATIVIEFQLAGVRVGSATLTEEGALDLALRLVGTVMGRRKAGTLPPSSGSGHAWPTGIAPAAEDLGTIAVLFGACCRAPCPSYRPPWGFPFHTPAGRPGSVS